MKVSSAGQGGRSEISSSEIKSALEIERITGSELIGQLRRMIRNNIDELYVV